MSIGNFVRNTVLQNPDLKNEEILAQVLETYPEAKTTMGCIAWYKSDMRKKGLIGGGRARRNEENVIADIARLEQRLVELRLELVAFQKEEAEGEGSEEPTSETVEA